MTSEQGFDDCYLRCGHESLVMAMAMVVALSWIIAIVSVVRLRDTQRDLARMVLIVEGK